MLVNPRLKFFNESESIILEVEDEGTLIKVDVTDEVLSLVKKRNSYMFKNKFANLTPQDIKESMEARDRAWKED